MKTNKTVKAEMGKVIDAHKSFLMRSILPILMLTCLSILSGCQDQIAAIKTTEFNHPVFANKTKPKTVPAQLASKVTVKSISDEEMQIVNSQDKESHIFKEISTSRYNTISILDSKIDKHSWKDEYDGIGVPLLRISF